MGEGAVWDGSVEEKQAMSFPRGGGGVGLVELLVREVH